MKSPIKRSSIWAIISGVTYGLFARFMFGSGSTGEIFEIMSTAFIIGVPIVLGFVSVWFAFKDEDPIEGVFPLCFILPWISGLLFLASTLLLLWEGLICIILWLPLVLILSTVGGTIGGITLLIVRSSRNRNYCLGIVALLPFIAGPIESTREAAADIRTVHSQIRIDAPASVVWEQIKTVPLIQESEHSFEIIHTLGFPRPLEATLIGEGVGAVRHATFEGDVLFIETITEWEPNEKISFSILADTENIPPTTFDEHVTIGGPYFDVFHGSYLIEPIDAHSVILHLTSDQRLSTRFNYYSHLWTEWLMGRLQNYILEIVAERSMNSK